MALLHVQEQYAKSDISSKDVCTDLVVAKQKYIPCLCFDKKCFEDKLKQPFAKDDPFMCQLKVLSEIQ